MTLFRKLFVTYLLVVILALVISGGFAGYLVFEAAGKTRILQLFAYGQEFERLLKDQDWSTELLQDVTATADVLDRTQSARVWLVDRQGVVRMASSSAPYTVGHVLPPEALPETLPEAEHQIVLKTGRRGRVVRYAARTDHSAFAVTIPIGRGDTAQGTLFLSTFLRGIRQTQGDIPWFIFYGSLVSAGVLAGISYYISQRISRPVAAVGDAARRVARGDFSSRVQWQTADEVGQLATAFNEMAADLERLERARNDLMANVSHELKGPLARIAAYLEAIHDGLGGPEARQQYLQILRREVARLSRLVSDLLDVSRLEAGRLKLHLIPCDLSAYLRRAAEFFEAPAQSAGIKLVVQVPRVLPIVTCEPERVEQAVTNLLENGLAFTPRGGSLTLAVREESGSLHVEVNDTGPGLAAAELDQVWDRFYKVDEARTPGRGGSGLGLAIVKQLIELQGGQVSAESTPERGSRFGFSLPLATPE